MKFSNGAAHQFNWKKIGLSRAYFKQTLVCEENMPTAKAKAAFRYIRDNSRFYANFLKHQQNVLTTAGASNISSYDLFIMHHGIECAMYPHLYPQACFSDTGIMQHYLEETDDHTNRVVSIGSTHPVYADGQFVHRLGQNQLVSTEPRSTELNRHIRHHRHI